MKGRCYRRRLADVVIGGARADDGRRMLAVLPQRVPRFGRTMHPQQTRRGACRQPARRGKAGIGHGTCALLGFTQDGTQARRGDWGSPRGTAKKRRRRAMTAVWQGCRTPRPDPLREPHRKLARRRRGQEQSDGRRGNDGTREARYAWAATAWRSGRRRRSQQRAIPEAQCDRLRPR
jgi:hypothetical protein